MSICVAISASNLLNSKKNDLSKSKENGLNCENYIVLKQNNELIIMKPDSIKYDSEDVICYYMEDNTFEKYKIENIKIFDNEESAKRYVSNYSLAVKLLPKKKY